MAATDFKQYPADANRVFLMNSHRSGVAHEGRRPDPLRRMEALTIYRDQLRAELSGVDAELTALASTHFAAGK